MGFGEWLQAERERQGFTLEQVEEETKIRRFYLDALEKDNFNVLPPKVYATGFVKKYGKFLGLDEQLLVEEFQRLAYANEPDEAMDQPIPTRTYEPEERRLKPRNILAGVAFLIVVVWLGSYLLPLLTDNIEDNEPNQVPPQTEQKSPAKTPAPAPVVQADTVQLVIDAQEPCWVLVVVDGENRLEKIIPAGEKLEYEGKEKIYIKAGNAGGLKLTLNGNELEPLGAKGEVAEKEFTL
ncbi:MAG: helix-turn-helix domain-containing protein [Syntrophomonadaceae bacterium]|nr:helix-turn-helix domain-containing protein [Syntrophomonadaceae bacterium]